MEIRVTRRDRDWEVAATGREPTHWPTEWEALKYARFLAERAGVPRITIETADGHEVVEDLG